MSLNVLVSNVSNVLSDGLPVEVVRRDARGGVPEHPPGVHLQLQLVGARVHQVPRADPRPSARTSLTTRTRLTWFITSVTALAT